ncbi:MAG: hypothetical protein LBE95_00685 [Holosporaceae bacterium]|jgi:small-conductance mechanosensitive channel|nr:hypothetical protein [Holosporaceae bacterium]
MKKETLEKLFPFIVLSIIGDGILSILGYLDVGVNYLFGYDYWLAGDDGTNWISWLYLLWVAIPLLALYWTFYQKLENAQLESKVSKHLLNYMIVLIVTDVFIPIIGSIENSSEAFIGIVWILIVITLIVLEFILAKSLYQISWTKNVAIIHAIEAIFGTIFLLAVFGGAESNAFPIIGAIISTIINLFILNYLYQAINYQEPNKKIESDFPREEIAEETSSELVPSEETVVDTRSDNLREFEESEDTSTTIWGWIAGVGVLVSVILKLLKYF